MMTTPWKKALRDFQQESMRSVLVVIAIAVGIAGFTAVLASYAILTRELNKGYLATNPASSTLRTDTADDTLLRAINATPGVRMAEARRTVNARIRGRAGWRNLVLFVVKDFAAIRVSTLNRERGAWPPAKGEILVERDAMQVARMQIGEAVTVRTITGPETALRLSGTVHDVGQAQARMENIVYGYITADTLSLLGEEPYLNQVKILVDGNAFDEGHIRNVTASVKNVIESRGHAVSRVDIPTPGKHPHADIMGLLMLILASFGFFVLILSGVIVVNLLTALMAAQTRQIGTMKAIGGTRSQIARIYLGQALLLGVAAIVIAIPAGILGSRALCRAQAVFLNFDITSFAIPAWVFLLTVVVGLIVPLLAAAYPVWKGTGVSVREALADFGVASRSFGTSAIDRMVAGMSGAGRPLLLAIRNNFRRRGRLLLTVLTLAAGGLFFMTALNLRASMINTLDRVFDAKRYDLSVSFATMVQMADVDRVVRSTPGIRRAEGWIASEASLRRPGDVQKAPPVSHAGGGGGLHGGGGGAIVGDRFIVIALPPTSELLRPQLSEGRWIKPGETDALVINTALAGRDPRMKVGNTVNLLMGPGNVAFRVVGVNREAFSPATGYISRAFFDSIEGHQGITNNVRVVLDKNDPASIAAMKTRLEDNFRAASMTTTNISSKGDSRYAFDAHMLMIYVALIIMSAMIGGVGGLGLMTTMSLNVLERRREMGVLRAIGASPRIVWLMLLAEGAVVGILSWAVAAISAWPLGKAVGTVLVTMMFKSGLDFRFEWRGLFVWLAVSLILGAIASFLPAWNASRRPVHEALGYE